MCGIIGINAKKQNIVPSIINGLKHLEYRGYDSAGVAGIVEGKLAVIKTQGKIQILEQAINQSSLKTNLAIGHTRWATHGAANQTNAHPHQTEQVSVVHNGIIENFLQIKQDLLKAGHLFTSQTDSEVIPHLITYYLNQGEEALAAVNKTIKRLEGAFSIAVIFLNHPEIMIAARKGSPLVIGYGEEQMIVASDAYALAFLTNKISYLEEGDLAVIFNNKIKIYDDQKQSVKRELVTIDSVNTNIGKGNFRHYMLKEIFEQPSILADLINAYYDSSTKQLYFPNLNIDFPKLSKITLVACGTSYYAAMIAKYWLEEFINLPIEVDIASEFRYRNSYLPENALCIFLSQSGETADTLAGLRYAKQRGQITLSIVNVKGSSLER
jgi:glucosamine--fructose-6-phosphate aminotransferase (isomerizing)